MTMSAWQMGVRTHHGSHDHVDDQLHSCAGANFTQKVVCLHAQLLTVVTAPLPCSSFLAWCAMHLCLSAGGFPTIVKFSNGQMPERSSGTRQRQHQSVIDSGDDYASELGSHLAHDVERAFALLVQRLVTTAQEYELPVDGWFLAA